MGRPEFRTKNLNRGFKATTDTEFGSVTFGLSRNQVWVTVTRFDGESFCSLDNPKIAGRLAAAWLEKEFWPAFASHLHPDNTVSDVQNKLF